MLTAERHVEQERSRQRDLWLNDRHRLWGNPLLLNDLDVLADDDAEGAERFIEYGWQPAVTRTVRLAALVEYKMEHARNGACDPNHHNNLALVALAEGSRLPAFGVRYEKGGRWWCVTPLNTRARRWVPEDRTAMTERDYIRLLYRLRGLQGIPSGLRFDDAGVMICDAWGKPVGAQR